MVAITQLSISMCRFLGLDFLAHILSKIELELIKLFQNALNPS